ncbi:MAG: hypothetical protein AAB473_01555 [Patescibacteria group bacterium]|mgnify:CR=1 FL=1
MNLRSRSLAAFAMFGLLLGLVPSAFVRADSLVAGPGPGDLIRGTSFSAVYYLGEDGFRYVFPNDKTYFTWYENFYQVMTISDADLAKIQMGGNVTYKPGVKMIKINSDPKTYFVGQGGTLHWVPDEATAITVYGGSWNTTIDDVPDGFFGNYTIGDAWAASDTDAWNSLTASRIEGGVISIGDDKELIAYSSVNIMDMQFVDVAEGTGSVTTIFPGQTVRWINNDSVNHTATAEDNSWGTGTMAPGVTFVRRFDTAGIYTYHCSYHPEMTGTIVVTAGEE